MSLLSKHRRSYTLAGALALACLFAGPVSPLTSPQLRIAAFESPEIASLRKRAENGESEAQEQLGAAYHFGRRGLKVDHALARRWLQRAADAGRPYAARQLAGLFRQGQGGPVDVARADALLRLAALKGDARSQAEIGYLHYKKDTAAERAEGFDLDQGRGQARRHLCTLPACI